MTDHSRSPGDEKAMLELADVISDQTYPQMQDLLLSKPEREMIIAALIEAAAAPPSSAGTEEPIARQLLRESRQYVFAFGNDEDAETQNNSINLLSEIDALLSGDAAQPPSIVEALQECVEILELVEHPRREDPDYGAEVAALGYRIGYGALMSSASASWRKYLEAKGYPLGSEFVAGPCQATVTRALRIARSALSLSSTNCGGGK